MGDVILAWVDRKQCIVVRNRRAVRLGLVQFAIFDALHRARQSLSADQLRNVVYAGVKDPALPGNLHAVIHYANRKLEHLGLKIRGTNRKQNSFYQIVAL